MFYSEQKKLPTEELEQMKALSNLIKQCGTARELPQEMFYLMLQGQYGKTSSKDLGLLPDAKPFQYHRQPMRHFDFITIKKRGDDTCPWRGSFRPSEGEKKKVKEKG